MIITGGSGENVFDLVNLNSIFSLVIVENVI